MRLCINMTPKEFMLMERLAKKSDELEYLKEAISTVEQVNHLKINMKLPNETYYVTRGKLEAIKDIHNQYELIKHREESL